MKPACRSSLEGAGPLGVTWNAGGDDDIRGFWGGEFQTDIPGIHWCLGLENSWIKKMCSPFVKGDMFIFLGGVVF